jgi:hypothetical protein
MEVGMDNGFVQGLQQLKKADPHRAIEVLFRLFESIGTMKVYQVAAAEQTLDLFQATSSLDASAQKALDAMKEALIVRAASLYELMISSRDHSRFDGESGAARISFLSVFGVDSCKDRIFGGSYAVDETLRTARLAT